MGVTEKPNRGGSAYRIPASEHEEPEPCSRCASKPHRSWGAFFLIMHAVSVVSVLYLTAYLSHIQVVSWAESLNWFFACVYVATLVPHAQHYYHLRG